MKLLLCLECSDVFKLTEDEVRSCKCGRCVGRYVDFRYAETNGEGICLAINNHSVFPAAYKVAQGKRANIECWARPHEGRLNPHTRINKDLKKE